MGLFDNIKINSPLRLSENLPSLGQQLNCDFFHRIKASTNPSQFRESKYPVPLFIWKTTGIVESDANYFLPTQIIEQAASCYPSGAYVFDPATGTGHVLVASQASCVVSYDMITDRI